MTTKTKYFNFSYLHYKDTLKKYIENGYKFVTISEAKKYLNGEKVMLLRHDIDKSVKKALDFAMIENELGIRATYFIRLHSNYYNPFGYIVKNQIDKIMKLDHELGLHSEFFDFAKISGNNPVDEFEKELEAFRIIFGREAKSYSLHRTTGASEIEEVLKYTAQIRKKFNVVGSYDPELADGFKYLSDSSGIWREGCFSEHVGKHERMQTLIHAEWWFNDNINLEESLV